MASYLLIESRDPFEVNDVDYYYDIASGLKSRHNDVTLFLVQNGVFPARQNPSSDKLSQLAESGVRILADELYLSERGISLDGLVAGVESSSLDIVIEEMVAGAKTIWH